MSDDTVNIHFPNFTLSFRRGVVRGDHRPGWKKSVDSVSDF